MFSEAHGQENLDSVLHEETAKNQDLLESRSGQNRGAVDQDSQIIVSHQDEGEQ